MTSCNLNVRDGTVYADMRHNIIIANNLLHCHIICSECEQYNSTHNIIANYCDTVCSYNYNKLYTLSGFKLVLSMCHCSTHSPG